MTPTIDQRLASMIRAMTDIVLPAIGAGNGLASEQAGLVIGHLHLIRQQLDEAGRYEQADCAALRRLAKDILAMVAGGPETRAAADALALATAAEEMDTPGAIRSASNAINEAIEELVHATAADGEAAFDRALRTMLIAHCRATAGRNRAWFAGTRFETADTRLPSIAEMLDAFERDAA